MKWYAKLLIASRARYSSTFALKMAMISNTIHIHSTFESSLLQLNRYVTRKPTPDNSWQFAKQSIKTVFRKSLKSSDMYVLINFNNRHFKWWKSFPCIVHEISIQNLWKQVATLWTLSRNLPNVVPQFSAVTYFRPTFNKLKESTVSFL